MSCFHYTIFLKSIVFNITTDVILKVFKYWEDILIMWWNIHILQNLILIWKLRFYHWQQTLSVVFLEVITPTSFISRKCLSNTQTQFFFVCLFVCQFFFQVSMVSYDKSSWQTSSHPTSHPCFLSNPGTHVLCKFSLFCLTDYWKDTSSSMRWTEMKCILLLCQGHAQGKLALDAFVFAASVWRWTTGAVCRRLALPQVLLTPQQLVPLLLWSVSSKRQIVS